MNQRLLLLPRAIRQARLDRHWTQEELARRLHVSQSSISFWERGIEHPSLAHQVELVTVLPEILEQLAAEELGILTRLYALERARHNGGCACQGCGCTT